MYAGLSLFIIVGPYLYVVVCVVYAYNLALLDTRVLHILIKHHDLYSFIYLACVNYLKFYFSNLRIKIFSILLHRLHGNYQGKVEVFLCIINTFIETLIVWACIRKFTS